MPAAASTISYVRALTTLRARKTSKPESTVVRGAAGSVAVPTTSRRPVVSATTMRGGESGPPRPYVAATALAPRPSDVVATRSTVGVGDSGSTIRWIVPERWKTT